MSSFSAIMETIMLICFGCSWPINIIKAWKARTAKSTSVLFYTCILVGYIAGFLSKIAIIMESAAPWYETVQWYVMFFYILNSVMVTGGILIYFRNKSIDKAKEEANSIDDVE